MCDITLWGKKTHETHTHTQTPQLYWYPSTTRWIGMSLFGILRSLNHRENGGTLGMVPLIINPIYTLYSGYLLGISKGSNRGVQTARVPHPRVPAFSLWLNLPELDLEVTKLPASTCSKKQTKGVKHSNKSQWETHKKHVKAGFAILFSSWQFWVRWRKSETFKLNPSIDFGWENVQSRFWDPNKLGQDLPSASRTFTFARPGPLLALAFPERVARRGLVVVVVGVVWLFLVLVSWLEKGWWCCESWIVLPVFFWKHEENPKKGDSKAQRVNGIV